MEQLQKFIECVNKTENIPSNLRNQILNAWLESDGSIYRVIGELLLTQNNHMKKCLNLNNTPEDPKALYNGHLNGDLNKIYESRYNWTDFIKCLQDYSNEPMNTRHGGNVTVTSVINELIDDIQKGNYLKALRTQFRLTRFGNKIIHKCNKKLGYGKSFDEEDDNKKKINKILNNILLFQLNFKSFSIPI